jgi:hypothetical protein
MEKKFSVEKKISAEKNIYKNISMEKKITIIKEEQIEGTQQKPQWIVSQGYSRTYNSWMQQSRLQWIYQSLPLSYD